MKRVCALPLLVALAALLMAAGQAPSATPDPQQSAEPQPPPLGDDYLYGQFLAQVARTAQAAAAAERDGMNGQPLRQYYLHAAQLTPVQAVLLNQVAGDLALQLAPYDANARKLLDEQHVLFQTNRLNHVPNPPPSEEIRALPEGRAALILQARDLSPRRPRRGRISRVDAYVRATFDRPIAAGGSQTGPQPQDSIPETILYRRLFSALEHYQRQAAEERRLGLEQNAEYFASFVQRDAGLTAEQGRALDQVATQYRAFKADFEQRMNEALKPVQKLSLEMLARDGKVTPTAELLEKKAVVNNLQRQMHETEQNLIPQLRTALGPDGFARLDAYVRRSPGAPSPQHTERTVTLTPPVKP